MTITYRLTDCPVCGLPVEPTRAALAMGLRHPRCTMPSLVASGTVLDAELDRRALRIWAVRQRIAAAIRRGIR